MERLRTKNGAVRILLPGLMLGLAMTTTGCAGHGPGHGATIASTGGEAAAVDAVWADPESAAIAALSHWRTNLRRADQRHMHVGSIVRSDAGYVWRKPVRSLNAARPVVRLPIDRDHVATYIVHPKSGELVVDRANDRITPEERRLVDEADPQHRPLFVLTPTGRLLSYVHGDDVVEVADLRRGEGAEPRRAAQVIAYDSSTE